MTLEAHNLTLSAGGKLLCRDLSFCIQPGECWGILGQNGSGKTTLLNTLAGLRLPDEGSVSFCGSMLSHLPRRQLARQLGVLPQFEDAEFWGGVVEYVLLGRFPWRNALFGYDDADEALARQSLEQVEMGEFAQRQFNTLSGGERQRVSIAQLLAQQTQYCLLDEPLQHLDLRHQRQVMRLLTSMKRQGQAILVVLHDMLWAQRCCDHLVLMLPDGVTQTGPTAELLTRENLETLFECPLHDLSDGREHYLVPGV